MTGVTYRRARRMDRETELMTGDGGHAGKDLEVHMRRETAFDPKDLCMRDADELADSPRTKRGARSCDAKLLADPHDELACPLGASLRRSLSIAHARTMPDAALP